ncbi:MAG TPA: UDP-3-O-(3-hydroxymyristoyl)glucosamine N-acyltransferase [Candidatus Sumerlaeota bacterium]|nr:MAG: UDP-3-O-acylglucosamine N-acyltransferase [candidate division BRC1 bacterium ADurb.Bin183]HOE64388.1 UDP-3-O-(3-hydroxymyristoyl)glucosamine N-acyltransferase [Candidatus Sumerlaeota bacterium]HRR31818.1 UDP-3-O-(3-hydroxymyristoyl)glucosamine N-acyltransferase [Candidatus Sumerlaeia bacterium]HON51155.1 UDP-3-O-(3-hydroxymyristoyl)glucosamine N-acyltransferase [Candidatus Sumerlaeota bacterium]HOR64966.1 UDP-3-O-(3-hydroxymyristoyl)glucosamine N-acyltransferase [Candidatus Sumerlaeota 
MEYKILDLTARIGAELSPPSAGDLLITGFTTLEMAGKNDLSFVSSAKYRSQAEKTKAAAVIVPLDMDLPGKVLLKTAQVWQSVIAMLDIFYPEVAPTGKIHDTAIVHESARMGKSVTIGPMSVIESGAEIGDGAIIGALCYIGRNAKIGKGVLVHPQVSVMDDCIIGDRVILHPGAVVGSDGFKFEVINGLPVKIRQVGRVVVEDDVEIGSNTCIDRASFTETRIGRGTKIDNLIQIAHNVEIGPYCMMAAQVGIAGSTKIGAGCIFGGQVGIKDNIQIGNKVMLGAQSGVAQDIHDGMQMFGSPAMPAREGIKIAMALKHLPELMQTIRDLKKRIEILEEKEKKE